MGNHLFILLLFLAIGLVEGNDYCKHIPYGSKGADPQLAKYDYYIHNYIPFHFENHIGMTKSGAMSNPCILDVKLPDCIYFHITREPIYSWTYYISPVPDWVKTDQNLQKHFSLNISWWGSEWDLFLGTNTEFAKFNITCPKFK